MVGNIPIEPIDRVHIGIDPGASGGIASYNGKELHTIKCPSGGKAMAHSVRTVVNSYTLSFKHISAQFVAGFMHMNSRMTNG